MMILWNEIVPVIASRAARAYAPGLEARLTDCGAQGDFSLALLMARLVITSAGSDSLNPCEQE